MVDKNRVGASKMIHEYTPEIIIADWLKKVRLEGGIERFHDLHIDDVSLLFRERATWVQGGLECLASAEKIILAEGGREVVALAMSLESTNTPKGIDFQNRSELTAMLDWSPPSLYIFLKDREPWALEYIDKEVFVSRADVTDLVAQQDGVRYFGILIEFRPEIGDGFNRTFYIVNR